jgi:hypothetical protein
MRWSWRADGLLTVLALVAEGAWLAVVYAAVQVAIGGQVPLLGTFELTIAAAAAALLARHGLLDPDERPLTFFAATVAAGVVGWLVSPDVRELLAGGNLVQAIGLHPGGWLAAAAFLRGIGRGLEVDDRAVSRLVLWGTPGLALPWIAGQLAAEPLRGVFIEQAFVATLTFVSAGFMAAGLARLQVIGEETGVDWRENRSWLGLLVGVLATVLAVGVPAAYLLGLPIDTVARGLLGPLGTLLGYVMLVILIPLAWLAGLLTEALLGLGLRLPPPAGPPKAGEPFPFPETYDFEQVKGGLLTVGIFWALVILLAVIVGRTWLRRRARRAARGASEERFIHLPETRLRLKLPRLRLPRPRNAPAPHDAVTAYLAALALFDPGELMGRDAESPRAHAQRVADRQLSLLAADYALARYAGRALTRLEHLRALGRWRRLRTRLRPAGR